MRLIRKHVWILTLIIGPGMFAAPAIRAAQQTPARFLDSLEKREEMIAMRDGVKLHTEIYSPKNAGEALPILMVRTPYGIANPDTGISNMIYRYADMFADGYIFVFQDIRGRYGSEGKFVMLRTVHDVRDAKGTDESTDAYDSIDWLVKNVAHNNGRVGMDGTSYDGFLVTMAMVNPHPALKAVSEQA